VSYLSSALVDTLGQLNISQTELARRAKITQGQANRACRGGVAVKAPTIKAIARALEEPHKSIVVAAWLKDQLEPEDLRGVIIETSKSSLKEKTVELPAELDGEKRDLVQWVANEILRHTAVFDMLRGLRAIASRHRD
jgi:transcriptional regulator with XRE-family HTH domain